MQLINTQTRPVLLRLDVHSLNVLSYLARTRYLMINVILRAGSALLARLQAQVRVSEAAAEEAEQRAQQDRDQDQAEHHPGGFLQADTLHPRQQGLLLFFSRSRNHLSSVFLKYLSPLT